MFWWFRVILILLSLNISWIACLDSAFSGFMSGDNFLDLALAGLDAGLASVITWLLSSRSWLNESSEFPDDTLTSGERSSSFPLAGIVVLSSRCSCSIWTQSFINYLLIFTSSAENFCVKNLIVHFVWLISIFVLVMMLICRLNFI